MSTDHSNIISLGMILRKTPRLLTSLPSIIKGIRLGKISNPTQPVGLGLNWEKAVKRNPKGIAFLYEEQKFTYHEFNLWANRISHYYLGKGIKKGDVVALMIDNRPELMACVIGLSKIGAVSAMINTQQTGNVLSHSLNLVKPSFVIVGSELADNLTAIRSDLSIPSSNFYCLADQDTTVDPGVVPEGYTNLATEIKHEKSSNPETTNKIYIDDPCFYIYTSGTTGLPKAGIFKHGRWMKIFGNYGVMAMQLQPNDIMYCTLPLYHATGLIICWSSVLAGSAGLVIKRKFSASNFWNDINKYNVTSIGYVGELCRYLMAQPEKANDRLNPVTKMLGNGLRPNVWKPFKERFGISEVLEFYAASDGNIGFVNMFNFDNTVGLTTVPYALVEYDKEADTPTLCAKGYMKRVKKGGTGLLLAEITTKAPLDGYTDKEKTNKVIIHDVFKKGDRWFDTGDLMRDVGFKHVQFVDRLGDTYRWKGENVSTTEVENLISNYPGIDEAVAYGVEIPDTNGRAGMASITPNVDISEFDFKHFFSFLKESMPHYAAPVFIRIKTSMDTTGTFKYKKTDLKKEAFDITKTKEPIYAALPGGNEFVPVTTELLEGINGGKYRF